MATERLIEKLAVVFFILSVVWLIFAIPSGVEKVEAPGESGKGVVKLRVVQPPFEGGAVVSVNVLEGG